MSGGGSSSPSETTTISKTEPPDYVQPYSEELMARAGSLSNAPYAAYEGQRISPLQPEHIYGLDMTTQRAMDGSPTIDSAQQHSANVFNDYYMNQGIDLANQANPYMGVRNQYAGDNPYMNQMIQNTQEGITDNYLNTINPGLAAMDRNSGAFGNSGVGEARAQSQENLLNQLNQVENQYRFQDYTNQQNLDENYLSRNSQLAGQQMANMLAMYGNERNNQMGAMEFAPTLANQDYIDAQNMLGVGDIYRNADQQNLDFYFDQWSQAQNWPYQQLDVLANAIRTSMGGGGTSVTSAPSAYSPNSTATAIGTGLTGLGAIQGLLG